MIVADASAIVEFLLGGPKGQAVEAHLLGADRVQVPAIVDAEVVQALRRLTRLGVLDEARGGASVAIMQEMPLARHSMPALLPRLWALRENLTVYDAAYVALAEALGCPLVTFDEEIASAPGHGAEVVVP